MKEKVSIIQHDKEFTVVILGLQQVGVPFSLVTSEAFKTDHSSTLRELPGDLRSLRPCQHNPQLDCGEIPRAPEHGVRTAGVTVIYSHPLLE